jgi:hypothetical protein
VGGGVAIGFQPFERFRIRQSGCVDNLDVGSGRQLHARFARIVTKGGAKDVMPLGQPGDRFADLIGADAFGAGPHHRHVVGRIVRLQLVNDPQPFLKKRQLGRATRHDRSVGIVHSAFRFEQFDEFRFSVDDRLPCLFVQRSRFGAHAQHAAHRRQTDTERRQMLEELCGVQIRISSCSPCSA